MALRLIKTLIGLIGIALIGVIGIHWSGGATRAGKALSERLTQTLAEEGFTWATVEVGRRKIVLAGEAPNESAARQAEAVARMLADRSGVPFGAAAIIETRFDSPATEPPAPVERETLATAKPPVEEEPLTEETLAEETIVEEPAVTAPTADELRQTQIRACQQHVAGLLAENPVRFASGGAVIEPEDKTVLEAVADALNRCPVTRVTVAGHTDATGNAAGNETLSRRRAEAVAEYLTERLAGAAPIDAVGYGESRPIADNSTRQGRAQNRRIEIAITFSSLED